MDGIGRYRIETAIGEGAMAMVWRAFDPGVGRRIAIKTLRPELTRNPAYVSRFLREAKAAGTLSHPNIVTIFDVGEHAEQPYIAMELLDGRTLDQELEERGGLPVGEVIAIGIQLADALAYAHDRGIVHRDIKPANVMLTGGNGRVCVLDFGIARMTEAEGDRTQIGEALGTPRYMSPEQALGQPVDGRSDLFATGVLLYELVTGRTAFAATTIASLALQIVRDRPEPIAEHAPYCPPGLRAIIDRLIDKNPDKRFATGEALAEALRKEQGKLSKRKSARRYFALPLTVKLPLAAVAAMAAVVVPAGYWTVAREDDAMRRLAESSARSMAVFVANNVALKTVENATVPEEQQDWLPAQSFIDAAIRDGAVRHITLSDGAGLIRAADRARLRGQLRSRARDTLPDGKVLRLSAPITYSGRSFGAVDVVLGDTQLSAMRAESRLAISSLIGAVMLLTMILAYGVALVMQRMARAAQKREPQQPAPTIIPALDETRIDGPIERIAA